MFRQLAVAMVCVTGLGCARSDQPGESARSEDAPYLLVFAGDGDGKDSDFLAVLDLRAGPDLGKPIASTPIGLAKAMPHHMEYALPPAGEPLFMNAHHHEKSLMVDVSNPRAPRLVKTFEPPAPFRFPHDYYRTPSGTRLVGFLRSEGASPDPAETTLPGNHGGIAEYSTDGRLLRTTSAAVSGRATPVRPYAFALLSDRDRLVVTSAPMMETSSADVVQVYRYSDFTLLETIDLPPGRVDGKLIPGSQRAGFGPRILPDGSVFFNTYGCAFYRLSDLDSPSARLDTVFALETPEVKRGDIRGSCGIPVVYDHFWLMPVGQLHAVVVLDIADPMKPAQVFSLATPSTFNPHWLARDPKSNRLVLGAELGGEEGFYLLRFDSRTGRLSFDESVASDGLAGYVSLNKESWPHGPSGTAWAHAALFLPE